MIDKIYKGVVAGDANGVAENIKEALKTLKAEDILNNGMIAAMQDVGLRFEKGECFVPEMLIAGRAMQTGLEALRPALADASVEPIGKVLIGTVQGDLHDIGKNLVSVMMEGAGFEVIDLGIDIKPETFVEAVQNQKPAFLGLSALLTTTMPKMREVINALTEAGIRDQVKVMVGGAPISQAFADDIGADIFASNAAAAANKAKEVL